MADTTERLSNASNDIGAITAEHADDVATIESAGLDADQFDAFADLRAKRFLDEVLIPMGTAAHAGLRDTVLIGLAAAYQEGVLVGLRMARDEEGLDT